MQRSLTTNAQDNDALLHPAVKTVDTWHLHQACSLHINTRLQKDLDKSAADYNNRLPPPSPPVHTFSNETSSFKRNTWKHGIDCSTLKSRVDTYENQIGAPNWSLLIGIKTNEAHNTLIFSSQHKSDVNWPRIEIFADSVVLNTYFEAGWDKRVWNT